MPENGIFNLLSRLFMKHLLSLLIFSCFFHCVNIAQVEKPVAKLVKQSFGAKAKPAGLQLFIPSAKYGQLIENKKATLSTQLKNYTLFNLAGNYGVLQKQITKGANTILNLPVAESKNINLIPNQITTPDFFVKTSDGRIINNPAGINNHFLGIADDDNNSIAAFSFNQTGVTGFFSNRFGNTIVEPAGNNGLHLLYNDKDIKTKQKLNCIVDEGNFISRINNNFNPTLPQSPQACKTVKMYVECTYLIIPILIV